MELIVIKELKSIIDLAAANIGITYDFAAGTAGQISARLQDVIEADADNGYIFVYVEAPITEYPEGGRVIGQFPRIGIATKTDVEVEFIDRYEITFLPKLYPFWDEIKRMIAERTGVPLSNIENGDFSKQDIPGDIPPAQKKKDYLDAIELSNLRIKFAVDDSLCTTPLIDETKEIKIKKI